MAIGKSKVIGIVGGMGPRAGLALYESILNNSTAQTDQQHLSVVLMSFPAKIGDRTLYLEGGIATNPAHEIVRVIQKLAVSGAEVIGLACNTSHSSVIFDVINSELDKLEHAPSILNMPREVCNYITDNHPGVSKIGLMATNGVYHSGVYKYMLEERGYTVITPDFVFQNEVIHRMIYDPEIGIKANPNITKEVEKLFEKAIYYFRDAGAEIIILGCTEFSLVTPRHENNGIYLIDSTNCLAKALIREALTGEGMYSLLKSHRV